MGAFPRDGAASCPSPRSVPQRSSTHLNYVAQIRTEWQGAGRGHVSRTPGRWLARRAGQRSGEKGGWAGGPVGHAEPETPVPFQTRASVSTGIMGPWPPGRPVLNIDRGHRGDVGREARRGQRGPRTASAAGQAGLTPGAAGAKRRGRGPQRQREETPTRRALPAPTGEGSTGRLNAARNVPELRLRSTLRASVPRDGALTARCANLEKQGAPGENRLESGPELTEPNVHLTGLNKIKYLASAILVTKSRLFYQLPKRK